MKSRKPYKKAFAHCDYYFGRKVAYHSADDAHEARKRAERDNGVPLRVYHCPHAPHWHLTHQL